jgi:hypothetical protein
MSQPVNDLLNELTPDEWRIVVSLVEAIATSDEAECPVCRRQIDRGLLADHIPHCRDFSPLRTRRLEVVDGRGQPVAVLGELHHPPAASTVGLALLDGDGMERAVLSLDHEGPKLEMTAEERTALLFGVNDPGPEVEPGTYLLLLDTNGDPVQSWRVDSAGRLTVATAGAESEADHG